MPDPLMDVVAGAAGMPMQKRSRTDALQEELFQAEAKCQATGDPKDCARVSQLQYEFEQAAKQEAMVSGQGAGMGGSSSGGVTGYRPSGQWYMNRPHAYDPRR